MARVGLFLTKTASPGSLLKNFPSCPSTSSRVAGPVQDVLRKGRRAVKGSAVPRQVGRRARGEGRRVALAEHFRHGAPRESILTGIVDGD